MACLEIADIANRSSIEVIPHVGGPTVVGLAANLQWATAARVRLFEFDIEQDQPMVSDIGENPGLALTDIADGTLTAPSGPGLGVEVDETRAGEVPVRRGRYLRRALPGARVRSLGSRGVRKA